MEGGKWGLIIIFSAFMIQFLAFGTSFAMGVYTVEFLDYFDNDTFAVSFILSINIGMFLGSGPIVSFLMTKFTHRTLAIVGGFMSFVGVLMMPVLPYLPALYFFYGIINAVGCCMAYTPSHVLSGLYYNKYQSLSTGVATSGSGLGSAVMPIVIGYLIEEYSWKGSLYIVSAMNLNIVVFAALLRPVPISSEGTFLKESQNCSEKMISEEKEKVKIQPKFVLCLKNIVKKHFFIFHDFGFVVYCLNNVCWNFTCGVTMTFIPDYLVIQGIPRIDAAFIVTICGLGTFVGGVAGAILGNITIINRIFLFSLSNILTGISCFIFVWISSYSNYLAVGFVYGFCFGITLGLLLVLVTDILGVENLGHGLGYLLMANGIGAFLGPPVAGYLDEVYGGYEPGIYTAGVVAIIGGLLLLLIPLFNFFTNKSQKRTQCTETELMECEIPLKT
ncbi:hypothetical protein LOTGIDRAFT_230704 [Lottia gigantea]|uniref:Major facilitator superfamily (MFS) profile domain-containing protein n=1 Tax=Lottia gigantea TaxID=225164 RepID=V4AVQ7_LOTGI|nr:hypothetical protein LOTGIDRAFT_230704 [Lottia gigantea]ESP01438.1 hypothetical protein LOTGIDRAFT_230704 [Lottia gigantea]